MYIVIGILAGIIILQFIIMWKYQRQVKDICRQLAFMMKHDSNMLINHEFDVGGIGKLSDKLNELLELRRKEKQHYQEKEALIADTYTNLSHDIRTPLTSLDGYFQLMEECENIEDQKRYLSIIHERIHSLNEMLEELFMFTKLKNESYSLELTLCCMNRILKETVFSYYDEWVRMEIQPDIQITEEQLYIHGNRQGLRRVIQNVIKNGLDHGEKKISIVLGREAYPGDVFYLHSRLLERAAKLSNELGGGSLTALPIIETQAGDVSAYIPTNVISITDGQIFLETELFHSGVMPAVNPGISVSRVGGNAQIKAMKKVAGTLKLIYSQYRELQSFAQFGSDLDADTKARLAQGERIVEVLKQNRSAPVPVEKQVAILYATIHDLLVKVKVADVAEYEKGLYEYLENDAAGAAVMETIRTTGNLDKDTEEALKGVLSAYTESFVKAH